MCLNVLESQEAHSEDIQNSNNHQSSSSLVNLDEEELLEQENENLELGDGDIAGERIHPFTMIISFFSMLNYCKITQCNFKATVGFNRNIQWGKRGLVKAPLCPPAPSVIFFCFGGSGLQAWGSYIFFFAALCSQGYPSASTIFSLKGSAQKCSCSVFLVYIAVLLNSVWTVKINTSCCKFLNMQIDIICGAWNWQ